MIGPHSVVLVTSCNASFSHVWAVMVHMSSELTAIYRLLAVTESSLFFFFKTDSAPRDSLSSPTKLNLEQEMTKDELTREPAKSFFIPFSVG